MKKLLLCMPVMLIITGSLYLSPAYCATNLADKMQENRSLGTKAIEIQNHLFQINASHSVALANFESDIALLMDTLSAVSKDAIQAMPIIMGLNALCEEMENADSYAQDSLAKLQNDLYIQNFANPDAEALMALREPDVAAYESGIQSRLKSLQNHIAAIKKAISALQQESSTDGSESLHE